MNALFQWQQRGSIRPMNPEGTQFQGPNGECIHLPEPQVVLMGSGITDANGTWTLHVRPVLCVEMGIVDWVSMVATPSRHLEEEQENVPVSPPAFPGPPPVITTAWRAVGGNLILQAWTADGHGNVQKYVPFSWHAAVLHHLELKDKG
jgi:hypothetical protein